MIQPLQSFRVDCLWVEIHASKQALGSAAASRAASLLRGAILERGRARIVIGTGPSQNEVIASLTASDGIDWSHVEVFHMDEYVGMAAEHPASFRRWLKEHFVDIVHPWGRRMAQRGCGGSGTRAAALHRGDHPGSNRHLLSGVR